MAEQLQSDMMADEQALEYLVHYGVDRVGIKGQKELSAWMLDMLRQTRKFMKNRTLGSAAMDMMAFLTAMDEIGGR